MRDWTAKTVTARLGLCGLLWTQTHARADVMAVPRLFPELSVDLEVFAEEWLSELNFAGAMHFVLQRILQFTAQTSSPVAATLL